MYNPSAGQCKTVCGARKGFNQADTIFEILYGFVYYLSFIIKNIKNGLSNISLLKTEDTTRDKTKSISNQRGSSYNTTFANLCFLCYLQQQWTWKTQTRGKGARVARSISKPCRQDASLTYCPSPLLWMHVGYPSFPELSVLLLNQTLFGIVFCPLIWNPSFLNILLWSPTLPLRRLSFLLSLIIPSSLTTVKR